MLRIYPPACTDSGACDVDEMNVSHSEVHECQLSNDLTNASTLFEEARLDNLKMGFPILMGAGAHKRVTWLDEVGTNDLPDAADVILLAHAARMAIRAVARVESKWRDVMAAPTESGLPAMPADVDFTSVMNERDRATAFYLETKERLARIGHLESINERARMFPTQKVRLPRAKRKKSTA